MQVATQWKAVRRDSRRGITVAGVSAVVLCGIALTRTACGSPANPAATASDVSDTRFVADLEQKALIANPKEQSLLYADLADCMTTLAGRQIADGQFEKAEATLQKLETYTAKMESNFAQSKSLKKTELLLHLTNRHLTDVARAASQDMKPHVQEALQRLNAAQASLLVVIFAK